MILPSLKCAEVPEGEFVAAAKVLAAARLEQRLAVLEEGGEEVGEEVRDEAVLLLVTLRPEHGNPLCKMTLQLGVESVFLRNPKTRIFGFEYHFSSEKPCKSGFSGFYASEKPVLPGFSEGNHA